MYSSFKICPNPVLSRTNFPTKEKKIRVFFELDFYFQIGHVTGFLQHWPQSPRSIKNPR